MYILFRLRTLLAHLRMPFWNRKLRDKGPETLSQTELDAWQEWWNQRGERELRALLLERWDPIGVGDEPECEGEYDGYLPRLAGILRRGRPAEDVADYLSEIERQWMEFDTEPRDVLVVATEIFDWHRQAMQGNRLRG